MTIPNVDYVLVPRVDNTQLMSDPTGAGGVYVAPATNFRAQTVTSTSILLAWDKVTVGHSGFKLEVLVSGVYVPLATPNETARSYQHNNLQFGTTYKYRLSAVDSAGNLSAGIVTVVTTLSLD
jgi:hypothetical protein